MNSVGKISKWMMYAILLFTIDVHAFEFKTQEINDALTFEALTLRIENDVFTGSDSQYTNGLSVTWSSAQLQSYSDNSRIRRFTKLFGRLPGFSEDGNSDYLIMSLIHEMNTPTDITIIDPPPFEQPYSGVLMLGTTLYSFFPEWSQAWTLRIGAVGPVTQSGKIQSQFHELISADEPMGWSTQLPNELLMNVGYTAGRRVLNASESSRSVNWRAIGVGTVELGNYTTAAGGSVLFEFGQFLPRTLSNSSIGTSLPSVIGIGATPVDAPHFAGYISVEAYLVAHFLPMDGTTFRNSRSADYDPLVSSVGLGGTFRFGNLISSLSINLSATPRDTNAPIFDYGGLSVGWVFD